MSQPPDHVQPRIVLAAFDPADVGPVRFRTLRQFLLRQPLLLPQPSKAPAERRPKIVHEAASWTVQVVRNIGDLLYWPASQRDRGCICLARRAFGGNRAGRTSRSADVTPTSLTDGPYTGQLACPICGGRGTVPGRARRSGSAPQYLCVLCDGTGVMLQAMGDSVLQLRHQMQRVADAMQAGDEERAKPAGRHASLWRFSSRAAVRLDRKDVPSWKDESGCSCF